MRAKTIAWVDDERYALTPLKSLIEAKGFRLLCAYSLSEALALLESHQHEIDLLIVDVMLDMGPSDSLSGYEMELGKGGYTAGIVLARAALNRHAKIPMVVFSACRDADAMKWFEAHGIRWISKTTPIDSFEDFIRMLTQDSSDAGRGKSVRSFIVHGHDAKAALDLKNYLQNTLRLPEPTILHERASLGRTVIEKFEDYAEQADVVFVLVTPDDVGGPVGTPGSMQSRARQNVVFELGYFFGKLRRKSGRVIVLYRGSVELPSDLHGIVYIDITNGILNSGEVLRRELDGLI